MTKVTFIDTIGYTDKRYHPVPAKSIIPQWYKKTGSIADDHEESKDGIAGTIKRCIPVFDAMSSGYIIRSHMDISVETGEGGRVTFFWPDETQGGIDFHSPDQVKEYPGQNSPLQKFISPWAIKTPRGYSCLFLNPMHQEDSPFTILEGIVDTDSYINSIHFPFYINDSNWSGKIPAGTPIAQVIPFKRESYSHDVVESEKELKVPYIQKTQRGLHALFEHRYKKRFWFKKDYN